MKILYFSAAPVIGELINKTIANLRKLGHEVEYLQMAPNEISMIQTRHFQMYEKILDYGEKNNFDILFHHDYLGAPEYLFFNLRIRPNYKPKIVFQLMLRESNRSLSRSLCMKELFDLPQILGAMVGCGGIDLNEVKLPKYLEQVGINKNKIAFTREPIPSQLFEKIFTREISRKELGIREDEFVLLWTGRPIITKGIDIFIESAKWIDPKIKLLLKLNPRHSDVSVETLNKIKDNHDNTLITMHPDDYYFAYCGDADMLVCSHKKLYEYGQSGIPISAALEGLPIVVPNFYFFNEVVRKYRLGLAFEPENSKDLARAINEVYNNYNIIKKNMNAKDFLKNYAEYEDTLTEGFTKLI